MASFEVQQGWLPEQNIKDCSLGFCTFYCPQWCYALPPPSPPFFHASAFSPLVITTISILATFSLLITYYTLASKFCAFFYFPRNRSHHNQNHNFEEEEDEEESVGEDFHLESWHLPPSIGLDESLIKKIPICKYKRGEGLVEGTVCSVCLSEFIEDEDLRLLPKCSHAFHPQCIDTWLMSHSNCPLCRVNVLFPSLAFEEEDEQDAVVIEVKEVQDAVFIEVNEQEAGFSRRGRGEGRRVRRGRNRGLHTVMSHVRMKRSVSSVRTWFARRGRGRPLLLTVCGKAA